MARMVDLPTGRFSAHFEYGRRRSVPSEGFGIRELLAAEELEVAALDLPTVPEPPRFGEGGVDCRGCSLPDSAYLWTDAHWRIDTRPEPRPLFFVLLHSRAHYQELPDLPPERAAELGPLLQRMEAALRSLGDVGRVHTHRWGDGGAHLHLWQIVRPEGMLQARGVTLPVWIGAQPPLPAEVWRDACRDFASAMALGGGTAVVG
jgi:diadenosine tetraphosphate (Ap4A) HIT family hydrolase